MIGFAEIAEAITKKFNSSIFKNSLTGGLYFQQAPQAPDYPYGVFFFIGASYDEIMGGADDGIVEMAIQFSLFTDAPDGGTTMALLAERCSDTFDWQQLNVDGFDYVKMQRDGMSAVTYTDEIWQTSLNYTLGICKEK